MHIQTCGWSMWSRLIGERGPHGGHPHHFVDHGKVCLEFPPSELLGRYGMRRKAESEVHSVDDRSRGGLLCRRWLEWLHSDA